MEIQEAVKTVRALADGLDPITGEIFPEDSPYQRPQVVRALTIALQKMEGSQQAPGMTAPAASSVPYGSRRDRERSRSHKASNHIEADHAGQNQAKGTTGRLARSQEQMRNGNRRLHIPSS
jgi:methylthioribose-1-phosphate isomerase